MTTTLTRPRPSALPLTVATTQVWGAMLSSYSEDTGGISVWSTEDGALRYAERVLAAQPGLEFELMTCTGNGQWVSVADGAGIREVIARRWSA
ncbi:hypothetical protein [Arthrobacter methylotrophus]|uniref:Uncharacterized protein n=1 Tax=Arthrobacter methylotrophus TaxID=121291 RepID=A0ABV5UNC7_9MICC